MVVASFTTYVSFKAGITAAGAVTKVILQANRVPVGGLFTAMAMFGSSEIVALFQDTTKPAAFDTDFPTSITADGLGIT